jgi:hypothetical protein
MISAILRAGIRSASQWKLLLPFYLAITLVSLMQSWPVFGNAAPSNPLIESLAANSSDAFADLLASTPAVAPSIGIWSMLTIVVGWLVGILYAYFAGGIISVWAGSRTLWQGSRHFIASFLVLGLLLTILNMLALLIGSLAAWRFGAWVGAGVALVLIQLVNVLGEYARAAAITHQRRNPFVLVWHAGRTIVRRAPVAFSLSLVGLALHGAIIMLYTSLATKLGGSPLSIVLEQAVVVLWLWVKILRLGWAWHTTQSAVLGANHLPAGGSNLPHAQADAMREPSVNVL